MRKSEQIIQIAKDNNGVVTTSNLAEHGIYRGNLTKLVEDGRLERSARGVYILPEVWGDDFINLQARYKKGIFSKETALFLWDLTDRTPNKYDMTFPDNYNLSNPKKEGVKCSRVKQEWYWDGIMLIVTPGGNEVKAYGMERTLCDILRARSGVDAGVVAEAFKRYSKRQDRNIPLLSEYARRFKVEEKVRTYLEVLI